MPVFDKDLLKMKIKSKRGSITPDRMINEAVYVMWRHKNANFYRKLNGQIQFINKDKKNNWEWVDTMIDNNDSYFIPVSELDALGALLDSTFLDKK